MTLEGVASSTTTKRQISTSTYRRSPTLFLKRGFGIRMGRCRRNRKTKDQSRSRGQIGRSLRVRESRHVHSSRGANHRAAPPTALCALVKSELELQTTLADRSIDADLTHVSRSWWFGRASPGDLICLSRGCSSPTAGAQASPVALSRGVSSRRIRWAKTKDRGNYTVLTWFIEYAEIRFAQTG